MSNIVALHNPWQLAADASDRLADLMDEIPGADDYEHAGESQDELRRAAALMREAVALLEQASGREQQRATAE